MKVATLAFFLLFNPLSWAEQLDEEIYLAGEEELSCLECMFPSWESWIEEAGTRNKCVYPVKGGGRVISKLGDPRGRRRHMGVDIKAPMNRQVVAAWGGKVVSAGYHRRAGYAVKIVHPNGYKTYYAHLNGHPHVSRGQHVKAGQKIGLVGMSGNAKGTVPHLHFEVHSHSGHVLNPLHFF